MIDKDMLEAIGQMMDAKLEPLIEDQRHTRVLMERMDKKIDALAEGQAIIREKVKRMDEMAARVEDIQITVNAMEAVTKQNCTDIKQLRAVK